MALFKNASPQTIFLGTNDLSGANITPPLMTVPRHLPLFYVWTQKGPDTRQLVTADTFSVRYGADSLNPDKKYFNHQSRFLNLALSNSNVSMIHRIIPDDAKLRANAVIYIDILETDVPNYLRNSLGDYITDPDTNDYKIDTNKPTISGYKIKYIKEVLENNTDFGLLKSKTGTMTGSKDNTLLNKVIRLTHYYNNDLEEDEYFHNQGTTKEDWIRENMPKYVAKWKTYSETKLNELLQGIIHSIEDKQGNPDTAPRSTYEIEDSTVTKSTMYPLFELKAKYPGSYYNNIGFTINSLYKDDIDNKITAATKSLPYRLSLYTRTDEESSPVVFKSLTGETEILMSFKEKIKNPITEGRFDFEFIFKNSWYNETDTLRSLRYYDYENFYFYRDIYELVTKILMEKERNYINSEEVEWNDGQFASTIGWFDFTTSDKEELLDENYLLNIFSLKSSKAINYFTIVKSDISSNYVGNQKEVLITKDSPIFLEGGSDGTFNNEDYEKKIREDLEKYLDKDSEYQDIAINVESFLYDSGFSLETKKSMINFITVRKNTNLVLTHRSVVGNNKASNLTDIIAILNTLNTRLNLAPDSSYFGTKCFRAIIVLGEGDTRDGTDDMVPLSYLVLDKSCKMMGSQDGLWKTDLVFDRYPNNRVDIMSNITPSFIPEGIKPTLWNSGGIFVVPIDRETNILSAMQTVYPDDTSVLNGYFMACAVAILNTAAYRVWAKHTGTSTLTEDEFILAVNETAKSELDGVFGSLFTVIPEAIMDQTDKELGYSWHLTYKIYGDVPKTVQIYSTETYRSSALDNQPS